MSSIQTYLDKVANFDKDELRAHLRRDYREQSQEWPDYLDYLDEWQWTYKDHMARTRKDFIYHYLAKRRTKIVCGDHFHIITDVLPDQDIPELVLFSSPDTFVDPSSCWYKKLLEEEATISYNQEDQHAARLTSPETEALKRYTALSLASTGQTPIKLDFETFKREWWADSSIKKAMELYKKSFPPAVTLPASSSPNNSAPTHKHSLTQSPQSQSETLIPENSSHGTTLTSGVAPLAEIRQQLPQCIGKWFGSSSQTDIIFPNDRVYLDHGLHVLVASHPNYHEILNIMSRIREDAHTGSKIDRHELAKAMQDCPACPITDHLPYPTVASVFYSPPGNGKTTAIKNLTYIGVDTDWLTRNSDFNTIIAPFLKIGVSVITNQYDLATNSGEKFFGLFNPKSLRTDLSGKEYTSLVEIQSAIEIMGEDILIRVQPDKFIDQDITRLLRLHYIYNMTRTNFLNKSPQNRFSPIDRPRLTFSDIIKDLMAAPQTVKRFKRRYKKR